MNIKYTLYSGIERYQYFALTSDNRIDGIWRGSICMLNWLVTQILRAKLALLILIRNHWLFPPDKSVLCGEDWYPAKTVPMVQKRIKNRSSKQWTVQVVGIGSD